MYMYGCAPTSLPLWCGGGCIEIRNCNSIMKEYTKKLQGNYKGVIKGSIEDLKTRIQEEV